MTALTTEQPGTTLGGPQPSPSNAIVRVVTRANASATPTALAVLAGMVSLGISCYQLSLPHVLSGVLGWNEGYDEGAYFGAATRFVHGVLPYRDFVLVHPPGIVLLMSPIALLGRLIGTDTSLEMARCVTAVVVAFNAVLVGLIVRPVGRVAAGIAAFSLALWPLAQTVDHSVVLEPYLVCFCLLGTLLVFAHGGFASWWRVLWGGTAFGFAIAVKVWGILPVLAVLLIFLPAWRRKGAPLALGIAVGAVIPCLAFFVAAPHAFVHDVITDQLARSQDLSAAIPLSHRLLIISGLGRLTIVGPSTGLAVVAFGALGLAVLVAYILGWRRHLLVEWFVLVASVVVFVGMFQYSAFYDHYAYFPAAFLAMLLGITLSRLWWAVVGALRKVRAGRVPRRSTRGVGGLIAVAFVGLSVVVFLVVEESAYAQSYLTVATDPGAALAAVIPPGACVISDFPTNLLAANRFDPSRPGCPAVVDPYGMYLAEDGGTTPHSNPPYSVAFEEGWLTDLQEADYVELQIPFSDYFPWTAVTVQWFKQNYRLVAHFSYPYSHDFGAIGSLMASEGVGPQMTLYVYQNLHGT